MRLYARGRRQTHLTLFGLSFAFILGCRNDVVADPDLEVGAASKDAAVIVGGIDWTEVTALPTDSAERANSRAVGHLELPAAGSRCTAFLITPDVVMTNQHCVPSASAAAGARVYFDFEAGTPAGPGYACDAFLGNDAMLDFALLQCTGRPGDAQGVLELAAASPPSGDGLYVIHQNCDWYADPSCAPTKKYSPGHVTGVGGELSYDADTLGGSSGSAVFSATAHVVIGLHHVGVGGGNTGRGLENRAVPMTRILPVLAERYPGLALGPVAAADPVGPIVSGDGYEPNNSFAGARAVALPFSSEAARIDAGDADFFAIAAGDVARQVTLGFSHAAGDLDMYLFDAAGQERGRSVGTTDAEGLTVPIGVSGVIAVVGYQGATGTYALSVQ